MQSVPLQPGAGRGQAADLFQRAQAGCPDSLDRLMAAHDGLVQAVIRKQFLGQLSFADALQAGRIGLWHAIMGYDPQRGRAFSTYAWPSITRQVWAAVRIAQRPEQPLPRSVSVPEPALDPVTACAAAAVQAALTELIACLPDPLSRVIVSHYGLGADPPLSLAAIGRRLGLCRERIRQLHQEALIWLRQPAHSAHLRSLLERHTVADYESAQAQAAAWARRRRRRHAQRR
jgi:RNA polymerase sigma factor (sigma-70 family)